jgi:hypothetical protein
MSLHGQLGFAAVQYTLTIGIRDEWNRDHDIVLHIVTVAKPVCYRVVHLKAN